MKDKKCYVAWSACENCMWEDGNYGNEVEIGFDKITKKWYHLEKSFCNKDPVPMEVMC